MWGWVCVISLFIQTGCYWAHTCTLLPCFPNVLFPWVAWILPPDLLASERGREQPGACGLRWCRRWSCSASGCVSPHKTCTPGVGRGQAQVPPRSSNQPLAPAKVILKTLNMQKRPISLEFNLSSWRCDRGKVAHHCEQGVEGRRVLLTHNSLGRIKVHQGERAVDQLGMNTGTKLTESCYHTCMLQSSVSSAGHKPHMSARQYNI